MISIQYKPFTIQISTFLKNKSWGVLLNCDLHLPKSREFSKDEYTNPAQLNLPCSSHTTSSLLISYRKTLIYFIRELSQKTFIIRHRNNQRYRPIRPTRPARRAGAAWTSSRRCAARRTWSCTDSSSPPAWSPARQTPSAMRTVAMKICATNNRFKRGNETNANNQAEDQEQLIGKRQKTKKKKQNKKTKQTTTTTKKNQEYKQHWKSYSRLGSNITKKKFKSNKWNNWILYEHILISRREINQDIRVKCVWWVIN